MPGPIPASQASPLLTTAVHAKYDELAEIKVNNFWRSFYNVEISKELYPAIDVRRGSEKVAIDVIRGHQGLRQQVTKSTQKAFEPFFYKNFFDATQLQSYFRMFGTNSFNRNEFNNTASGIATEMKILSDTLDRAIEIMCGSIFKDGTITSLRDGSIVDFKRKAESMVDPGTGFYWDNPAVDIIAQLKTGCDFLRQVGKVNAHVINCVMGADAWAALRKNEEINRRWNTFNNKRDMLQPSQLDATGAVFQTIIDVDSYKVAIWTYNDFYDDPTDTSETPTMIPYMDPKQVYLLPEKPKNMLVYGAIPQVTTNFNTDSLIAGEKIFTDYRNPEEGYHRFYLQSAPLPVPIAIDQMYTLQALAA